MLQVFIHYTNGSFDANRYFDSYSEAADFCRSGISYSGNRVRRVEIRDDSGSNFAVWDIAWDDHSKVVGLRNL